MTLETTQIIDFSFYTEGPVVDDVGNIYCTTLTGGHVKLIDNNNVVSVWATSQCPNGQVILPNGDHLVCDSGVASVYRFNRHGAFIRNEIEGTCAGVNVEVPNDVIIDDQSGFYFTDSVRHEGRVFYRSADGKETVVYKGLDYPNGLALTGDQTTLFVAESYKNRIIKIPIKAPGLSSGELTVIADLPFHSSGRATSNLPDGLAIDQNGFIWIAHYGMQAIQVVHPVGKHLRTFEMPFPLVSNICISTKLSQVIVTGGYAEPGPGAVAIFSVKY